MPKSRLFLVVGLAALLANTAFAQSPGQGQGPGQRVTPVDTTPKSFFHAVNYEVHASLDGVGQVITAQAKVDFAANEPSRLLDVELHPNLRVTSVRDTAGRQILFDRDDNDPLKLRVTLPDLIPTGGRITLQFEYA